MGGGQFVGIKRTRRIPDLNVCGYGFGDCDGQPLALRTIHGEMLAHKIQPWLWPNTP
jgi:hypothetical protein